MPDLPHPRDREEREKMVAAFLAGQDEVRGRLSGFGEVCGILNDADHAEHALPPVSPSVASDAAPAGELPELGEGWQWAVLGRDGIPEIYSTRSLAEHQIERFDSTWPSAAPHRVVRLAVVEVVEPEAPDSWERLAKDAIEALPLTIDEAKAMARRARLLEGE